MSLLLVFYNVNQMAKLYEDKSHQLKWWSVNDFLVALDSTQSELFDVKAKFDEVAAARYSILDLT